MNEEKFTTELKDIHLFYKKQTNIAENRTKKLIMSAINGLGDYLLSKGFIFIKGQMNYTDHVEIIRYYYDKNTKVGIKIHEPYDIRLDRENNFIPLRIIYKIGNFFEEYDAEVYYRFTIEDIEKVFKRFKSYNGKAGVRKVKIFMREHFKKEMLIVDRNEKIKNLNKL